MKTIFLLFPILCFSQLYVEVKDTTIATGLVEYGNCKGNECDVLSREYTEYEVKKFYHYYPEVPEVGDIYIKPYKVYIPEMEIWRKKHTYKVTY